MTAAVGLTSEIRDLLAKHGPLTSAELFDKSEIATERQQVYFAIHGMKKAGELTTIDKRHHLGGKPAAAAGPAVEQVAGQETAAGEAIAPAKPKAGPSRDAGARNRPAAPPAPEPGGEIFAALLTVLLGACGNSSDAGIRELSYAVRQEWEQRS